MAYTISLAARSPLMTKAGVSVSLRVAHARYQAGVTRKAKYFVRDGTQKTACKAQKRVCVP